MANLTAIQLSQIRRKLQDEAYKLSKSIDWTIDQINAAAQAAEDNISVNKPNVYDDIEAAAPNIFDADEKKLIGAKVMEFNYEGDVS